MSIQPIRKRTVAFVCNTSFGMANFRLAIMRTFANEGFDVYVIAPPDQYSAVFAEHGLRFIAWDLDRGGNHVMAEISAVTKLSSFYKTLKPDLAFHFTIKAVIYGSIAAKLQRIPSVSVITGLGYVFLNRGLTSWIAQRLYRLTLNWSREVWFLNEEDRHLFVQRRLVRAERAHVMPGEGVDVSHFAPTTCIRNTDRVTFLMVARILADKGVREYAAAARQVKLTYPGSVFLLLGATDESNPSRIDEGEIATWTTDGSLEYLGSASDVRPFVESADCIVLPSYREGTPRALLEGSAMERAVIATDVPGCRDVVMHQKTGFLCKVKDSAALATAMSAFCGLSAPAAQEMGRNGRRHVIEKFSDDVVRRFYLDALKRINR